jgi:hypothetical protein
MNTRLAQSVEELASIIKDYAKKHKKLSDRVSDIEKGKKSSRILPAKSPANNTTTVMNDSHSPPTQEVTKGSSKIKTNRTGKLNTSRDISNVSGKSHQRRISDKENMHMNVTTTTHNAS